MRPGSFLSRRSFLGGAAVVLPLPAFASWPRSASAAASGRRREQAADPVRRLLVYHVPNGFHRAEFTPKGEGASFELAPTMAALEDLRRDILIPRGLANTFAVPIPLGGSHAVGVAALLTCQYPRREQVEAGTSVDQVIAAAMGDRTWLPSLQLGIDTTEGGQEVGWPLVYARTISWAGPAKPLPNIISPARAFERMFMGFDPHASRAATQRRRADRSSVLDAVRERAARLAGELGAEDRPKLDEYLGSVREVERRIQGFRPVSFPRGTGRSLPDETADYPTRLRHFHDVATLAFKLDVTRVITFSTGNGLSTRAWPHLGIGNGHTVTHHSGNLEKIEAVKKMDRWRMARFAELLRGLKAARDPDGRSLLETSAVLYLSEIGDGNRHDQYDKPMIVAGQLGGAIRTGRVLHTWRPSLPDGGYPDCSEATRTVADPLPRGCTDSPQLADFYLGLLAGFGVRAERFGQNGTRAIDLA